LIDNNKVQCKQTYAECPVSTGCSDRRNPFRCTTGECVENIGKCPWNVNNKMSFSPSCDPIGDTQFERCFDGKCRPLGACNCVQYSGCPFLQFECPNGLCTNTMGHCGKYGRCFMEKPFTCGGGSCVRSPEMCPDRISAASFPDKVWHYKGQASITSDDAGKLSMRTYINSEISVQLHASTRVFDPPTISPYWTIKSDVPHPKLRRVRALQSKPGKKEEEIKVENSDSVFNPEETEGNAGPYNHLSKNYDLQLFDGSCTLNAKYVGVNTLKNIKNKFEREDIILLTAYYREKFEKDSMPPHLSLYSAPVTIGTTGRLDDNADFGEPLQATFHMNYMHMINRYLPDVTQDETAAYVKYFQMTLCLAMVDWENKEWKCINRIPSEVKQTQQNGKNAERHKRLTAMYEVPRPGTYAIIMKPKSGLSRSAYQKTADVDDKQLLVKSKSFIMPVTIVLAMVLLVAFFYCLGLYDHIRATNLEARLLNYKLSQIDGCLPDFPGQTPEEKLNANVRYFKNPAFGLDDFDEIKVAYQDLEKNRSEHDEKRNVQIKHKGIRRKLKINQEFAKQVDDMEENEDFLEQAVDKYSHVMTKYSGYLLQKNRYELHLEAKLKRTGYSLKGPSTIEVYEPEEEEGEEMNEAKAEDGGDAGEQEVEAEAPVEEEAPEVEIEVEAEVEVEE